MSDTCLHCGEVFNDKIAPRYTVRRLYCNKACYSAANKATEIPCKVCNKLFKVAPPKVRRNKERGHVRVHCSEACRRRGNSLRMFGIEPDTVIPNGSCGLCGIEVGAKRLLCRDCHQSRKHRIEKAKAIEAYGRKCSCCGESNIAFLTLDHVHNDGAAHRRELKEKHGYDPRGIRFYAILRSKGYPQDGRLQVLCWNCNCAKQFYGGCPHKGRNLEWLWQKTLESKPQPL